VAFREQWSRENAEAITRWEHLCIRRGVYPLSLSTEDDTVQILSRFFSGRRPRYVIPSSSRENRI